MYYGTADKSVPPIHAEFWKRHYPRSVSQTLRLYPNEGHDVQYRHWDQVLADMAVSTTDNLVVCWNGHPRVVRAAKAERLISAGRATLGLCMWR
jgi:hypothetical protein